MKKLDVPQSGSQAATTASRNRFGQYNRTRAMPTQPRTSAQVEARERLSNASAAWRGLTEVQRENWNAYALTVPQHDALGQTITMTGHMKFVAVNSFLASVGLAQVTTPPTGASPGVVTGLVLTVEDTPTLGIEGENTVATGKIAVYASPPVSAGVSFNSRFRFIGTITAAAGIFTEDFGADYAAIFGNPPVGKKVFVKVVPFDALGNVGAETRVSEISV